MNLYINKGRPGPRLYLAPSPGAPNLILKSTEATALPLFLADLSKGDCGCNKSGNPHRDPSVGQYIAGGGGAAKGKGQKDLSEEANSLMDKPMGQQLEKTK
jgi:hypothetical protein